MTVKGVTVTPGPEAAWLAARCGRAAEGAADGRPLLDTDVKLCEAILALSGNHQRAPRGGGVRPARGARRARGRARANSPPRWPNAEWCSPTPRNGPCRSAPASSGRARRPPTAGTRPSPSTPSTTSPGTPSPAASTSTSTTTGWPNSASNSPSTGRRWTWPSWARTARQSDWSEGRAVDGPLPHPALEVVHPLRVPGEPADADPRPRRPGHLDESGGRRGHRGGRQRLGRSRQRQRRRGGPRRGLPPHADRHRVHVPRTGAPGERAQVRDHRAARRRSQRPDQTPHQTDPSHRRIRPVVVRPQLLRSRPETSGTRSPTIRRRAQNVEY